MAKRQRESRENYYDDSIDVVSTTGQTGLFSALPKNESEAINLSELYDIPVDETFKGPADEN